MTNMIAAMTRGASGLIDRQSPLDARGAIAAAGKAGKKAKKKAKKKARQLCQSQVAQCQASLTELCEGDPGCLEGLACCDFFGACDTTGALVCIVSGA